MENVTQLRPNAIRQYDNVDGGYILISEQEFSAMSEETKKQFTLNERIPTDQEIHEWREFNKFNILWQKMVDKLEEMSAGRPKAFTKKGHPIKWRYSTHDIANVLSWTATASSDRIKALEEEIERLKAGLK